MAEVTGYEQMTDREFWAEVGHLLTLTTVGHLADYVHTEAERRDAELAENARRRMAMVRAESERTDDVMDLDLHFTAEEEAEFTRLRDAYYERFALLAGAAADV